MEWIEQWSKIATLVSSIVTMVVTIGGAALFLWGWGKQQRKAELHTIIPAAAELAQDFFDLYKIARNGESFPEKVKLFQSKFIEMARERGYEPTPTEIAVATTMGSAYHKAAKRAVLGPAASSATLIPGGVETLDDAAYADPKPGANGLPPAPPSVAPIGGAEGKA